MRFNRWVMHEAMNDIARLCQNHPQSAIAISLNAEWIIEQLAEDAHLKGDLRSGGNGSTQSYRRWAVGPIVGIFRVLPLDDRTVVIEGFTPNS